MRLTRIVSVLIIGFIAFGCSKPTASNPTSIVSASPIIATPINTSQPVPTAELLPKTSGPYISYFREIDGSIELIVMDADGMGRKTIHLPEDFGNNPLLYSTEINHLSADGKWLAYYTGSAGEISNSLNGAGANLTLNLLDLESGKRLIVAQLLSKDYPNNFIEALKELKNKNLTPEQLQFAFLLGITQALSWSPDGRYLAFAGQMDGLSSDLYIYDTLTQTIQRLTDGPDELQWIKWSPNGKWIVHGSAYEAGMGMKFDVFVVTLDGSPARFLETTSSTSEASTWLNPDEFFDCDAQNGAGTFGLRLVNILTGEKTKIWGGAFQSPAIDSSKKWAILYAITSDKAYALSNIPGFISGTYLIDLNTLQKYRVDTSNQRTLDLSNVAQFGNEKKIFFLDFGNSAQPRPYFLLLESNNLFLERFDNSEISASPGDKYWAVVTNHDMRIFSMNNVLIGHIIFPFQDIQIPSIVWRPDLSGMFLISGTNIYSLNISDGKIQLVESGLAGTFMWISKQ